MEWRRALARAHFEADPASCPSRSCAVFSKSRGLGDDMPVLDLRSMTGQQLLSLRGR